MGSTAPAAAKETSPAYTPMVRDLPLDLRPRKRMLMAGCGALSNAELLAIVLRTGTTGESVIRVAENLLVWSSFFGFSVMAWLQSCRL
jgi:DNA repair protein RadC